MQATGPLNPAARNLLFDETAVHDHAFGAIQNAPQHQYALVIRTHFQAPHPLAVFKRGGAAIVFQLSQVGVPVAALDHDLGEQMMQVRLMHHDHARVLQRGLIRELVMRIIADLVQRDVEARGVEGRWRSRENFDIDEFRERFQQRSGIIRNAAFRRWQRRKISYPHDLASQFHRDGAHDERNLEQEWRAHRIACKQHFKFRFGDWAFDRTDDPVGLDHCFT